MPKNQLAEPEGTDTFAGPEQEFLPDVVVKVKPEDPTLDPADPRWNPKKYFAAQVKELVLIPKNQSDLLSDPSGEVSILVPVSINGYRIDIEKGVPTRVPRDFARHLVDIGAGIRYADVPVRE